MDFASLGIVVTSNGVREGAAGLDDLTNSAVAAEGAAERLAPAMQQAGAAARATVGPSKSAAAGLREVGREATVAGASVRQVYDSHVEQFRKLQRITMADSLPGARGFVGPLKQQQTQFKATELSARQYGQAMRLLPAQITDIVTSLASGSPAYLVAIQQGGQLRDSFGGFGQTLKALGTVITPTRLAIGGLVGGAGLLLKILSDGQKEAYEFNKAIALSGNAAGTTGDQLRGYAQQLDAVVGTEKNAAAVLAQLASTGQVGNDQLKQAAETAIRLQRDAGVSIEETVKNFASLGQKPTEALLKLNEQYHFLTAATYGQVKALEESGNRADAAAVAMDAFGSIGIDRMKGLETQLGYIGRATKATGGFFKEMWDSILDVGRPQTDTERLEKLRARIAKQGSAVSNLTGDDRDAAQLEARIALRKRNAEDVARLLASDADAIRASDEAAKEREANQKTAAAEAERLRKAQFDASLSGIQRALNAEVEAYDRQADLLEARFSAGLVGQKDYYDKRRALIEQGTAAQVKALNAENQRLQAEKVTGVESIQRDQQILDNDAKKLRLIAEQTAAIEKLGIAQQSASTRTLQAYNEEIKAGERYIETLKEQYERELQAKGLGRREQTFNTGLNQIQDRQAEQRRQLERDRDNATNPDQRALLEEKLRAVEEVNRQELDLYRKHWDDLTALQADWTVGAKAALNDYLDQAKDVAGATEAAWTNALQGGEDALLDLVMTGKANFGDLANSIIRDLLRIQLKAQIANLLGLLGLGGGGPGGSSSIFNGGIFGGPKAAGGPIKAGTTYLVGEKGPELIVPQRDGFVVPNHAMGGGGVTISQSISVAAGVDQVALYGAFAKLKEETIEAARSVIADDAFRQRGNWARA